MIRTVLATAFLLGLLCLMGQTAEAGFRNVLFQSFCPSFSGNTRDGCHYYLSWRIIAGYSRDDALKKCEESCIHNLVGTAMTDCNYGCKATKQQDN